jgi:serine phosphatase RsbU (regulator of sigma subunit)
MAYRLSPARRVLFAVGGLLLIAGWVRYFATALFFEAWPSTGSALVLVGGSLLFQILLLELRDKLALKGDLEVARQIQFGLLPFEPYDQDGLSIRVAMRPANTVGGDYFDLIDLGQGRLAIVVADVAGKGMPAALLMALLQASLRTLISAGFRGGELLTKLNTHLYANIPSNRLITLFYAEADPAAGQLRYVNAGHNAPMLLREAGSVDRLPATTVALGVMLEADFRPAEARLSCGDRLLLYTDGVTEAFNARDEEYGEQRLQAFLSGHRDAAPAELVDAIVKDVLAFGGGVPPHDDITLMVALRNA